MEGEQETANLSPDQDLGWEDWLGIMVALDRAKYEKSVKWDPEGFDEAAGE